VVGPQHKMFHKGQYINKLPYYDDKLDVDDNRCSVHYYEWVKKTGNQSVLY